MKAVIQRVTRARVSVAGEVTGEIGAGALVLLCVQRGDGPAEAKKLAERIAHFRFFEDAAGRMNLSLLEGTGHGPLPILLVSQFTLAADGRKGRRPSFDQAEEPSRAREVLALVREAWLSLGLTVAEGRFGAEMQVELVNDGPVTFFLEQAPAAGPAAPPQPFT
ncbi:MAG: D-aminoacyl-tRNA deacylase [Planctomycetota bacterium]